jgi:hypothetical protein
MHFGPKCWHNGEMNMILSSRQITNDVSKHFQLAKVRKSQRIKKSTLGQTLIFNEIGQKMPF